MFIAASFITTPNWKQCKCLLTSKWIESLQCFLSHGRGVCRRMDICICIAESLHCSPEAIPALLIGYTVLQFKIKKFEKRSTMVHPYIGIKLLTESHTLFIHPRCTDYNKQYAEEKKSYTKHKINLIRKGKINL